MIKLLILLLLLSINSALAARKYNQYKQPQHIFENMYGAVSSANMIFEYLQASPAYTGVEMNVNGAVTPVNFDFVMTDSDESILGAWIARIHFSAINGSMNADDFFGLSVLNTGVQLMVLDSDLNIVKDFTNGMPLKRSLDFSSLAGNDALTINDKGASDDSSAIRWTLQRAGAPLFLLKGERVRIIINDDLTGMTQFRTMVQGIK